jgi:hypothetical protein
LSLPHISISIGADNTKISNRINLTEYTCMNLVQECCFRNYVFVRVKHMREEYGIMEYKLVCPAGFLTISRRNYTHRTVWPSIQDIVCLHSHGCEKLQFHTINNP